MACAGGVAKHGVSSSIGNLATFACGATRGVGIALGAAAALLAAMAAWRGSKAAKNNGENNGGESVIGAGINNGVMKAA
jgi:hypothetical protein